MLGINYKMTIIFPKEKSWIQIFLVLFSFFVAQEYINKGKYPVTSEYYSAQIAQKNLLPQATKVYKIP
jgi:hypothetical protein